MLLGLDFDDDLTDAPDGTVSSLYEIGNATLSIRQHPGAGRQHADGYEQLCPEESASTTLATAADTGGYVSNTPNVGWLVWSSTFVLARHLLAAKASWAGVRVLELGAGVGILGLAMAKHGARVTITDLPHVTPWARTNTQRNFTADDPCRPRVCDYMWGDGAQAAEVLKEERGGFDVVLAADCVYEHQHYPSLLVALQQTMAPDGRAYVCYKRRRLRQELFVEAARGGGWRVEERELDDSSESLVCINSNVQVTPPQICVHDESMSRFGKPCLKALKIVYCEFSGSSKGVRQFVQELLPKFQGITPVAIEEVVTRGRHPYWQADYVTGNQRTVGLRKADAAEVLRQGMLLRTAVGRRTNKPITQRKQTQHVTIQGMWQPPSYPTAPPPGLQPY